MAPKKPPKDVSEFEVAIAGDGITPEEVPLRETLNVLSAALGLVETVASESEMAAPALSLVSVHRSSAGYALRPATSAGNRVVRRAMKACRARGRGFGPEVRRAISRLFSAAKSGRVRLRSSATDEYDTVNLAEPIDDEIMALRDEDTVYGTVVAVARVRDGDRVTIRYTSGGSSEFRTETEIAKKAASLFNESVRAEVTFIRSVAGMSATLESIEPVSNKSMLDLIEEARRRLDELGLDFGGSKLLEELRRDRED